MRLSAGPSLFQDVFDPLHVRDDSEVTYRSAGTKSAVPGSEPPDKTVTNSEPGS